MRKGALLAAIFALLICLAPIIRMALDSAGALGPVTSEIFSDPVIAIKLWHTLLLAALTTLSALITGVLFSMAVTSGVVPLAGIMRAFGVIPLMLPPIVAAMAWTDTRDPESLTGLARWVVTFGEGLFSIFGSQTSLLGTVFLLTLCLFPFVSIFTIRALESIDARLFDSARLARGEVKARLLLLRLIAPDALAGALFVFVFTASEFGIPEYLSVIGGGKGWYTFPEEIFRRWDMLGRKGEAAGAGAVASSWPLILLTMIALIALLRFRAKGTLETVAGDHESLCRRKGHLSFRLSKIYAFTGFTFAFGLLILSLVYPVAAMLTWTQGLSTFAKAWDQGGNDLVYSLWTAGAAGLLTAFIALPIGHMVARSKFGRLMEGAALLPLSVPAILLGIGFVRLFNGTKGPFGDFLADLYDKPIVLILAYTARFLPLAILACAAWFRRLPKTLEEAAIVGGPGPLSSFFKVHLPLALPAAVAGSILTFVLSLRELDLAARLPAGNATAINRISNVIHFGGQDVGAALAILILLCAASPPFLYWVAFGKRVEVV